MLAADATNINANATSPVNSTKTQVWQPTAGGLLTTLSYSQFTFAL